MIRGFLVRGALLATLGATYLMAQAPAPAPATGRGPARQAPRGGGLLAQAGSADKHITDPVAAERGKKIYIAECITCHGGSARGTQTGPDLVRSLITLHDRYGSEIGPFLKKGHPTQSTPAANFTPAQIADLSDFIHLRLDETLRTSATFHGQYQMTGDAKAGQAYFNGAGKCSTCHSATGDLKGIGAKYEPIDMQQKFLFPKPGFGRGGKQTMVTVTPASGPAVTGVLDKIDDFNVSLRDADGEYHGWTRTSALKVKVTDPYEAHGALLDQYTDKNMHDLTAYLETLK
jgi:cytochrome c oxidase cbb3-type subunit 3